MACRLSGSNMGQFSGDHYSDAEEVEIFANWFQRLWQEDPEFAEQIVAGMIEAEFPAVAVDRTE